MIAKGLKNKINHKKEKKIFSEKKIKKKILISIKKWKLSTRFEGLVFAFQRTRRTLKSNFKF